MELINLKGVGEKRVKALNDAEIFCCEDLINYFPYKYYDFSKVEGFAEDGRVKLIKSKIVETPKLIVAHKGLSMLTCKMLDDFGAIFNAVWFNQNFLKSQLTIGKILYLYGKNSPSKKNIFNVIIHKFAGNFNNLSLLPVYHKLDGVGQQTIKNLIEESLECADYSTILTDNLLSKYNLIDLKQAYQIVHNPISNDELDKAFNRIEIEKLLPILAINEYYKFIEKEKKGKRITNGLDLLENFKKLLPYSLTQNQINAMRDIEKDISSSFVMNRMLQGDVGSGKTIVALFGAYLYAKNGYQAVICAPTEILASQHYETARKLFENEKFEVVKLTGSTGSAQKKLDLLHIQNGYAKIIIGTHSLFSESVKFKDLAFVTIDEQHRFGVRDRGKIKDKGSEVDMLVMSATPIPRSLNLVLFGDLDLTVILERPKAPDIETKIVYKNKQDDMWKYLKAQTENGSKVYVVCSKIDEENDDDNLLQFSAKSMFENLKKYFKLQDLALIHGKINKVKQNQIINDFKLGKIKVLVSTTIVEVGVDVPDSDYIVIATPERFGLATLHQLRGRVGRNGKKSWCFCLGDNLKESSLERIEFFKNHISGFEIAEFDLKTRGAGSVIGTNQHGKDNGILSHFSEDSLRLSIEILEQIKSNKQAYVKLLEKGNTIKNSESLKNIVLN